MMKKKRAEERAISVLAAALALAMAGALAQDVVALDAYSSEPIPWPAPASEYASELAQRGYPDPTVTAVREWSFSPARALSHAHPLVTFTPTPVQLMADFAPLPRPSPIHCSYWPAGGACDRVSMRVQTTSPSPVAHPFTPFTQHSSVQAVPMLHGPQFSIQQPDRGFARPPAVQYSVTATRQAMRMPPPSPQGPWGDMP